MDQAISSELAALAAAVGKGDRTAIVALAQKLAARGGAGLDAELAGVIDRALGDVLAEVGEDRHAMQAHARALDALASTAPDPRLVLREIDALIALAEARGDFATAARLQAIAVDLTRTVEGEDCPALRARLASLSSLLAESGQAAAAAAAGAEAAALGERLGAAPPTVALESARSDDAMLEAARPPPAAAAPASVPAPSRLRVPMAAPAAAAAPARGDRIGESAKAAATAPAAETASYQAVEVFFATSRRPTGSDNPYRLYSGRRNEGTTGPVHSYGIAEVSIPVAAKRQAGSLPVAGWLDRHPGFDSDAHYLLKRIRDIGRADWERQLGGRIAARPRREALIYVHGFNIEFWEAMVRAAQLHTDLDIDGAVATYSWPSRGNVLSYLSDRQEIIAPHVDELKRIIGLIAQSGDVGRVTVVAHSMGCEFLLPALEKLQLELAAKGVKGPLIKDVIFAAPDVDVAHFAGVVPKLTAMVGRVSVYTSEKDQALSWGRWLLASYDRAGNQAGKLAAALKGVADTIDTTEAAADSIGHTDYASSAIDDLRATVWLSLMPERRPTLVARRLADGPAFWVYRGAGGEREAFRNALTFARMHGGVTQALAALRPTAGSGSEAPAVGSAGPGPGVMQALTAMA